MSLAEITCEAEERTQFSLFQSKVKEEKNKYRKKNLPLKESLLVTISLVYV